MIAPFLDLPAWSIVLLLALLLGATGALIHAVCFRPPHRALVASFFGVHPPFFVSPGLLFALLTGFLANNAWVENRQAVTLLIAERDGAASVIALGAAIPSEAPRLQSLVRNYLQAVVTDEWPSPRSQSPPPPAAAALTALLNAVTAPELGRQTSPPLQSALIAAVQRIADARAGRLALSEAPTEDAKWFAVLLLAVLSQTGVAAVHLEQQRAQALALTIFTSSAVVLLSLIAVCERPYHGSRQLSHAPLQELLQSIPAS
jgi:hypothetical protein